MISVIVPIYNVEPYLKKCVDSIVNQTESDLEIILVDDGSTDCSGAICDEYAKTDPRICVYHKSNGGLMSAWKYGVCRSSGEYIGFVDSDDFIDSDMYERMLACALKYQAGITMCGLIREYGDHCENETIYLNKEFYTRSDITSEIFPYLFSIGMLNRYVSPNRVTKLFRRDVLVANLDFCNEQVSLGEDLVITFACLCDTTSLAVCRNFFPYHYQIRENSIMGEVNYNFYKQSVLLTKIMRHIASEKNVFDFSLQLTNDFLSLVYYGIETNTEKTSGSFSVNKKYIKYSLKDSFFQQELKKGTLCAKNRKCRIYKILGNLHGYTLMYLFIKRIVLPIRKR